VAKSPHISSYRARQPATMLTGRAEANTRPMHSGHLEERHRALTYRTPLTCITSMSSGMRRPRSLANVLDQVLPPSTQQARDLRQNGHLYRILSTLPRVTDLSRLPPRMDTSSRHPIVEHQTCTNSLLHQLLSRRLWWPQEQATSSNLGRHLATSSKSLRRL
jgi:hypothetical protein